MPSLPKFPLLLGALALAGFADSSYLTAEHYLQLPVPCYLTSGCGAVLASAYSIIGGMPLSLLGAVYYLSLLLFAAYLYTSGGPKMRAASAILAITALGVAASSYFVYLQAFVIRAFCFFCLVSAALSALLFSLSLAFWLRTRKGAAGAN